MAKNDEDAPNMTLAQMVVQTINENPELEPMRNGSAAMSLSMPGQLLLAVNMFHALAGDEYGTPQSMCMHIIAQAIGYDDKTVLGRIGGKKLSDAEKAARKLAREAAQKKQREAFARWKEQQAAAQRTQDIAALRGSLDARDQAAIEQAGAIEGEKVA